ncbi:Uncharacterised protein [uncultured Eubacterium sp.]|nr:Uncharacterised protein [uncultured Eubacterium sp.]
MTDIRQGLPVKANERKRRYAEFLGADSKIPVIKVTVEDDAGPFSVDYLISDGTLRYYIEQTRS